MKKEELFEALGDINEEYIKSASEKRRRKTAGIKKWGALAASLGIVILGAVLFLKSGETAPPDGPGGDITVPNKNENLSDDDGKNEASGIKTSEKYSSLEELLLYLSKNDGHDARKEDGVNGSVSGSALSASDMEDTVSCGEYVFAVREKGGGVSIWKDGSLKGSIDTSAAGLFLTGGRLAVVSQYQSGGNELDPEMSVKISVYDISSPEKPRFLDEFIQTGSLTAAYLTENRLLLLTSDGECACGYSRLEDKSGYVPGLVHGEKISWGDEDISILGEPTAVRYTAVTVFDLTLLEITGKEAFYGDVENVFYGADWLAFSISGYTEEHFILPAVYAFDTKDGFEFKGKISFARVFELSEKVELEEFVRPKGEYPYVMSVTASGGAFRVAGYVHTRSEKPTKELFVTVWEPEKDRCITESLAVSGMDTFFFDDIIWEEERAIITVSHYVYDDEPGRQREYSKFVFAEFTENGVSFYENGLESDRSEGVDMMYGYGSPFGHIKPLIDLGNGIYLKYNDLPDGFDIYDFSNSEKPICLYKSEGEIPEGCRFEFENFVYGENIFGVMMITPNSAGEYRNVTYTWRVYRVDTSKAEPFELIEEITPKEGLDLKNLEY